MSLNSLNIASQDVPLQNRTIACCQQEAHDNPAVADTAFARAVILNPAEGVRMAWPVALNTEAEYEYALNAGHPQPIGGDEAVITDAMILSAVQASWPPDPPAA
jgi:hypothetical protein